MEEALRPISNGFEFGSRDDSLLRAFISKSIPEQYEGFYLEYLSLSNISKICILTMNYPRTRNAFGKLTTLNFSECINTLHTCEDESIRCLIIRSNVKGIFSAGSDLKERLVMPQDEIGEWVTKLRNLLTKVSNLNIPVIAAIDGTALGGGLELALASDIRICAQAVQLGLTETTVGIMPGGGGTQRLPRLVGVGKAKGLIFTGKIIDSTEGYQIGLVDELVEQTGDGNAAYQRAIELCKEIADRTAPLGVKLAKLAINSGLERDIETGLEIEEKCYGQLIATADRVEGLLAFVEKRRPSFRGL